MSRGLGVRQRAMLEALRTLDRGRRGHWWSPAEVLTTIDAAENGHRRAFAAHQDQVDAARLDHLQRLVGMGWREHHAAVAEIETRLARREAERAVAAAHRQPNTARPEPRGGEAGNPSRVLALLARRGLVERVACRGPGSAVRVAGGQEARR